MFIENCRIENFFMYYIFVFLATFVLSLVFTLLIKRVALFLHAVDVPGPRKIHQRVTPLMGGTACFLAFFVMAFFVRDYLLAGNLAWHHWFGVFFGACFLIIGGVLDDKYNLSPKYQIIFPILAALSVIIGGVEIGKISSPFGGFIDLNFWQIPIIYFSGAWHYLSVVSDVLIFIWLLGMMYTTKLLDGVDGLVSGVVMIGAVIIFLFTISTRYYQPDIALAALILAAACLGFLVFNWHPASIFLGEGGSLFLGFILGVLAIISGGKIAVALLVMGVPIMDVAWTIIRRLREGKNPFKFSDRKHLHHRLLDLGIGQRATVLIFYSLSLLFGLSALFLQSRGKLLALLVLFFIMVLTAAGFGFLESRKR